MFRFLCTRQRCTRARVPHTLVIALRSALPPSITNNAAWLESSPRSTSSSSNALHTSPFSVAPSRKPNTRFDPSSLMPSATTIVVCPADPIDVHHRESDVVQTPLAQLRDLLCRGHGEGSAHTRALHPEPFGGRLDHSFVFAARHSPNHPGQHRRRHCFFPPRQSIDFQRQLPIGAR